MFKILQKVSNYRALGSNGTKTTVKNSSVTPGKFNKKLSFQVALIEERSPMTNVQPSLEFIPPAFNPLILQGARLLLPLWLRYSQGITPTTARPVSNE